MTLKNAAVYWNYKNVITGKNDHVMSGTTKIPFEEGYWTFDMIEEKLGKQSIKLEANEHNNTCKIYSESQNLNLKKFGKLLGFPENEIVNSGTWKTSPSVVDVSSYRLLEWGGSDVTTGSVGVSGSFGASDPNRHFRL